MLPVRASVMVIIPPCASEYTSHGFATSGTVKNPSPYEIGTQSTRCTPRSAKPMVVPHQLPLSCKPPQTWYGFSMSTLTW